MSSKQPRTPPTGPQQIKPPSPPPRKRPRTPAILPQDPTTTVRSRLQLRDALKQLEADSPPVENADAEFVATTRPTADIMRAYYRGEVVFLSRGILRAIIAELG